MLMKKPSKLNELDAKHDNSAPKKRKPTTKKKKDVIVTEVKSASKSKTIKNLITNVIVNELVSDNSSNALFSNALGYFKDCVSHKSVMQGLKEIVQVVADEQKASKYFVSRVSSVLQLASKTVEFKLHVLDNKVFVSQSKLFMYNISKAINLLDYLRQNKPSAVNKVKNVLNKVKKVTSKRDYNDAYASELKGLYKEYKVALLDDGAIIKVEMSEKGILKFINELTPELKVFLTKQVSA